MKVETDGINKPKQIYYSFNFWKKEKVFFGISAPTDMPEKFIDNKIYLFSTNGEDISPEKFPLIEKAIYDILNNNNG